MAEHDLEAQTSSGSPMQESVQGQIKRPAPTTPA